MTPHMTWEDRGKWLHGNRNEPPVDPEMNEIAKLPDEVLQSKKTTAEEWLAANLGHRKYAEALSRYEKICDELESRLIKQVIIDSPQQDKMI